ncbi:hypothetical protein K2P56_03150 [Patescibacteria group bacterium]|nr:hypothetical protein [Patescibacteria group bacterium]
MSDAATVEGLAVSAPRKTLGEEAVALWRRVTSRRQRSEVVAPIAVADEARLEEAPLEVAAVAELTRETFADASADEIIAYLKSLNLAPTPGSTIPEEEQRTTIWNVTLSPEGRAAALLVVSESRPEVQEGEEDPIVAAVALLKAELALPVAVNGEVEQVVGDVVEDEAAALVARNRAELLALADRFAIGQKDRGTLAVLAADASLSSDAQGALAETLSALKAQLETVTVTEGADDAAPLPLALDPEKAKPAFEALIAALEATSQEVTDDIAGVEQEPTLVVEGNDRKEDEVVVVEAVDGDHDKRAD